MALIKCKECGKKISDKAVSCPHCGVPISSFDDIDTHKKSNQFSPSIIIRIILLLIGWLFTLFFSTATIAYVLNRAYITAICMLICGLLSCPLIKKLSLPFLKKLWLRILIIAIFFILGMLLYSGPTGSSANNPKTTEIENPVIVDESPMPNDTKESIDIQPERESSETDITPDNVQPEENAIELSEDEFKSQCIELWHDDIFFSDSNLENRYAKLDLFVEEERFFKTEALTTWPSSDFIKEYELQRTFFYCGVQRVDEYSYVGGQINLFFSNEYDIDASDIEEGDHVIVYGEIIEFSTNTLDGYNYCSFLPRYIENNGQ